MYKITILIFFFFSCQENSAIKKTVKNDKSISYYFLNNFSDSTQDFFEYLGEIDILNLHFKVVNNFKRIRAAEFWHGQSRLIFLSSKDTLVYILDTNRDFPSKIENSKLYFPQNKIYYLPDSLSNILCLPTGCVEKDVINERLKYLDFDSIKQIFRGGFLPP